MKKYIKPDLTVKTIQLRAMIAESYVGVNSSDPAVDASTISTKHRDDFDDFDDFGGEGGDWSDDLW